MAVASRLDSLGNFTVANTGIFDEVSISDSNQYSVYFAGSGYYLSTPSSTSFDFGTNDFTLEAWIYPIDGGRTFDSTKYGTIISQFVAGSITNSWGWAIGISAGGVFNYMSLETGGTNRLTVTGLSYPINTWHHVACVRNNGTITFYINGVSVGSASYASAISYNASASVNIGRSAFVGAYENWLKGYISNLRVVKGRAVYTSNFIPSKSPLTAIPSTVLLTCQSSPIVDNSSNAFTITNTGTTLPYIPPQSDFYAASFNGSSQYISMPAAAGVASYASDFTIEFWFYANSLPSAGNTYALASQLKLSTGRSWRIQVDSDGNLIVSGIVASGAGAIVANAWYHVAWTKNSTANYLFINGTLAGTAASSTPPASTDPVFIGATNDSASPVWLFPGKISNFRIVKGTAVYTGAFTPSIDLAPISGTSVLTLQNSSLVDNSTNRYAITNGTSVTSSLIRSTNFFTTASQQSFDGNHKVGGIYDEVTIVPLNQYAALFNGTTKYLNTPTSAAFSFGTGDFTIECWAYKNTSSTDDLIITNRSLVAGALPGRWYLDTYLSKIRMVFQNTSSVDYEVTNTGSVDFPVGQWFHLAAVKSGSTITGYLNGVAFGNISVTGSFGTSASGIYIGSFTNDSTWAWNGYVSNVRIVNGQAVYTQNFTPTRAPLTAIPGTVLLTCQNSTFVDNSTNGFAITNTGTVIAYNPPYPAFYAASFNGSSQYLSVPSNTAFQLSTGDFTIEMWINITSTGSYAVLIDMRNGTSIAVAPQIYLSNGDTLIYHVSNVNQITGPTLSTNTWYHVAVCRSNSVTKMYVNGTQVGSNYTDTNNYIINSPTIGIASGLISGWFPGYISNLRIVKGTAVYTGSFTPPTQQLTAVSGTSLLTCQSSTIIDKSTNAFTITNNGSVLVAPASPLTTVRQQYSDGDYLVSGIFDEVTSINESFAASFDGSSQYLNTPSNTAFTFGTGDFTIEAWINGLSFATNRILVDLRSATLTVAPWILISSTDIRYNVAGSQYIGSSGPLSTNQWYHIAAVRNSGSTKLYVNGSQVGSTYADTNNYVGTIAWVGGYNNGAAGGFFSGYISNFRIVKGVAVYTGDFTPPQSHLTAIPGTILLTCQSSTLVDNSTNAFTITNTGSVPTYKPPYSSFYAANFSGSNRLTSTKTGGWLTSAIHTVECWVYLKAYTATASCIAGESNGTNVNAWEWSVYSTDYGISYRNSGTQTSIFASPSTTVPLNTWCHVAFTRDSTNLVRLFLNGIQVGSGNISGWTSQNILSLGYLESNFPYWFNGYISNFRIINGTALYTSDFTPPSQQLTAISGTSFLTCKASTIIDEAASATITNTGSVTVAPREPF